MLTTSQIMIVICHFLGSQSQSIVLEVQPHLHCCLYLFPWLFQITYLCPDLFVGRLDDVSKQVLSHTFQRIFPSLSSSLKGRPFREDGVLRKSAKWALIVQPECVWMNPTPKYNNNSLEGLFVWFFMEHTFSYVFKAIIQQWTLILSCLLGLHISYKSFIHSPTFLCISPSLF